MPSITSFETALQFFTKAIDAFPIQPLRQPIVGRRLLEVNPAVRGMGVRNIDVYSITEMRDAIISMTSPEPGMTRDRVEVKRGNVEVPSIQQGFEISREEILAYANGDQAKIDIVGQSMTSAIYTINKAEDNLIINGAPSLGITGLYNATTVINGTVVEQACSYTTAKSFAVSGNPKDAVSGAIALVNSHNIYPMAWNLVLNPQEWNHLSALSATNTNIPDLAHVRWLLNPGSDLKQFMNPSFVVPGLQMPGGTGMLTPSQNNAPMGGIYVTPAIAPGTGLLLPVDPDRQWMQLFVPQDLITDVGYDTKAQKFSPYYVTMEERLFPHVKHAYAVCQLTNIA